MGRDFNNWNMESSMKKILSVSALFILGLCQLAFATGPTSNGVQQSGSVTATHCAIWVGKDSLGDSGTSCTSAQGYPTSGIAVSTGSAWGTSLQIGTSGAVLGLLNGNNVFTGNVTFSNPVAASVTGNAATATALAAAPTVCSGGQFALGIAANGNASCSTPTGSGNVSGPGSSTAGYAPLWSGTTGTLLATGLPVGTSGNSTIVETNVSGLIASGIVPTLNQNTTGTAASFTGSLSGDVTGTQSTTAIAASTVTGKALTGFSAGAGSVTAADTILTAFNKIVGNINALVSGVSSVFGRTGAVTAQSGDYTVSQVTGAAPAASPTFTGTANFAAIGAAGNIAGNTFTGGNATQYHLDASGNISTSGTVIGGAFTGTSFNGVVLGTSGSATTFLNGAGGYTTPAGGSATLGTSAAAPSPYSTSSTGTGLYSTGSGQVGVTIGSTSEVSIASTGMTLAVPLAPANGGTSSTSNTNLATMFDNVTALLTPKLRSCIMNVVQGISNCDVLFVGDSTTDGTCSTNNCSGDQIENSYSYQLAAIFNAAGINASTDSFMGFTGVGNDSRINVGSDWSDTGQWTLGGAFASASANTSNPLTFTPRHVVDTFVIYYITISSNGTMGYGISGAGSNSGTFATSGVNGYATHTITTTRGINTLSMNWSSGGTVFVIGVKAYDSTHKTVNFVNAGWGSSTSTLWATATYAWEAPAIISSFGQAATFFDLGINDWGQSTGTSAFGTNMQALMTDAATEGDVILISPNPTGVSGGTYTTTPAVQATYVAVLNERANTNSDLYIDIYDRWVSYLYSNGTGIGFYAASGVQLHPNGIGYGDIAKLIYSEIGSPHGYNGSPVFTNGAFSGNVNIGTTTPVAGSVLTLSGHVSFVGDTPTVSSCGSGSLVTGSTDNKGQISGITSATACTITFATPLPPAPACSFSTSTGIAVGGIPTTSAVTPTMALFTGTLGYQCF
jgi:hypothetical protein